MPSDRPVSTEPIPEAASAPVTSAARAERRGSASPSVATAVIRSGASRTRSAPNPARMSCIRSAQRLVASSRAIPDSAAVTTSSGPVTAITPCAASRSTSTRPARSVPMETRPGNNAAAAPDSAVGIRSSAAAGSRQTWPSPTAVHGFGGRRSAGATHRSRLAGLRWAANTVGGVRPERVSACDRYRSPVSSSRADGSWAPLRSAASASAAAPSGPTTRRPNARCHNCSRRRRPSAASRPEASSAAAASSRG